MKVSLVRIGNSQGVRLPKSVIEQCGFGPQVELEVIGNTVVIAPGKREPREGWGEAFDAAPPGEDEEMLLPGHLSSDWDEAEWTW